MAKQVEDERKLMESGSQGSGNLVSTLVRAGTSDKTQELSATAGERNVKPLTDAEIFGNIFVFNFAGHDTTAISLVYAVLLLAANPEVQDWIHEEINYHVKDADVSTLKYGDIFPKLKRCLAVLVSSHVSA
jgi:cytochrome P450